MSILNYTTKVSSSKTIPDIVNLLAMKGASSITQDFGQGGKVVGVRFTMPVGGFPVLFVLPANTEGVFAHMQRHAPPRYRNREQAERVSWRILYDGRRGGCQECIKKLEQLPKQPPKPQQGFLF